MQPRREVAIAQFTTHRRGEERELRRDGGPEGPRRYARLGRSGADTADRVPVDRKAVERALLAKGLRVDWDSTGDIWDAMTPFTNAQSQDRQSALRDVLTYVHTTSDRNLRRLLGD